MGEIIISTKDLYKSFKKKEVLKGLNLNVNKGSIYGFLGKNGAGKTTAIKCLLGLFMPTSGEAKILGQKSTNLPNEVKARIGYIAQEHDLFPWMRVSQIIQYTKVFYEKWNDELTSSLLKRFEISRKDVIGKLSVGQAQRLAIVLTLAFEPDILVLDEPAAALDPSARRDFLETILDIIQDGKHTVLLSSHITSDVERVADTIGILKDGIIQIEKPIEELRETIKKIRLIPQQGSRMPEKLQIEGALNITIGPDSALVTVENYSEKMKTQIEKRWNLKCDVFDINLEDVFLAYHTNIGDIK